MSSTETTWHQSEHSEDSSEARKRSSRACDQCRKTKSKCKRKGEDDPCRSCTISGSACTFFGPSFKRGPPKGYIHAIEQRLRQVESVLGTIVGSSDERAQGVIEDLRGDALARAIIDRVDGGPFGSRSRSTRADDLSDEPSSSLTGIIKPLDFSKYDSKARRESRLTREIVSSNDVDSLDPTLEWQDHLSAQLKSGNVLRPTSMNDPSPNSSSGDSDPLPDLHGLYTIDNLQGQENELDNVEDDSADTLP